MQLKASPCCELCATEGHCCSVVGICRLKFPANLEFGFTHLHQIVLKTGETFGKFTITIQ